PRTVGRGQVGGIQQSPEGRIAAGLHHKLRVDRTHLVQTGRSLAQESFDSLHGPRLIAVVYSHSKYPHPAQQPPLYDNPPVVKYKAVRRWEQIVTRGQGSGTSRRSSVV